MYGLPKLPFSILSGMNSGDEEIRAKLDAPHSLGLLKIENLGFFFITSELPCPQAVSRCFVQDGVVRAKLAELLVNNTDVHYVNSKPSSEALAEVLN